jgi:hypothetical protein
MTPRFTVRRWAAFAPGLETQHAWRAWAAAPWLPEGDVVPALSEMPPMSRRRVERLGRMALQVAWHCQDDGDTGLPLVFGSRHGDIGRTHEMLETLARDEPLSPTHFGLSTHNAIAAQYSIARGITANYSVVAAGARTAEATLSEAVALLADGAPEVLAVMYDQPPPVPYRVFADEPLAPYAWAWRIAPPAADEPGYSLDAGAGEAVESGRATLPGGLRVLQFLLAGERELAVPGAGTHWCWRRHD